MNQETTAGARIRILLLGLSGALSGAIGAPPSFAADQEPIPQIAEAELKDSQGKKVGTVIILETAAGVKLSLQASGLPPGTHGIHFHEQGRCDGPKFKSSGEHFKPEGKEHGLKNPKGSHAGDLPNLNVNADGSAVAEMMNDQVTLGKGKNSLLKKGGTALIIHAGSDDQKRNPSGNSGDRIACGIVKAKRPSDISG